MRNVVERVEKSYVDKPDARKPLDLNLLRILPKFLIDQNNFFTIFFTNCCAIYYEIVLITVRQEVK